MPRGYYQNAVNMSHRIMEKHIQRGDSVIDATCGRGQDTLFLATLVGPGGKVWAFDIQEQAITDTHALLTDQDCVQQVELIQDNHALIDKYINKKIKACMFNLGYLPGGNHQIITKGESTIAALTKTLAILAGDGLITIVTYSGHAGGQSEYESLIEYMSALSQKEYEVIKTEFINQNNNPPQLLVIRKNSTEVADEK